MRVFFAGFELDSAANVLRKDGIVVKLHPQPLRALIVLAARAGELVTREELRQAIWREGTHVDFERGLNTCIRQIRAALADDGKSTQIIETISGLGYRFAAPVTREESTQSVTETTAPAQEHADDASDRRRPSLTSASVQDLPRHSARWAAPVATVVIALSVIALNMTWQRREPPGAVQDARPPLQGPAFTPPGRQPQEQRVDPQMLYLRGHAMFERGGDAGSGAWTALRLFERAATLDPSFARAHVGLAEAYTRLAVFDPSSRPLSIAKAREGVQRALALDASAPQAYVASAEVRYRLGRDIAGAEHDFLKAVELDPLGMYTRERYSAFLSRLERTDEALAQVRIAKSADPLALGPRWHMTNILTHIRHYDECVVEARQALDVDPTFDLGFTALGKCLQGQGKLNEAIEAFVLGGRRALGYLGHAYAVAGRGPDALSVLAALKDSPPFENQDYDIARIQVGLGQLDAAIESLTKAHDRGLWLGRLRYEEAWAPLQGNARFNQFLSELK